MAESEPRRGGSLASLIPGSPLASVLRTEERRPARPPEFEKEDNRGMAWVSYNSPAYLPERHGVPPSLVPNVAVVEGLAAEAGE